MSDFSLITTFGSGGTGNEQLTSPVSIATDGKFIYIVDQGNTRILKWRMINGSFVNQITGFTAPSVVTVTKNVIFIGDNDKLKMYNSSTMLFINEITGFSAITGLDFDNIYLYIVDSGANSIYRYLLSTMKQDKSLFLASSLQKHVSVSHITGFLFIVDGSNSQILVENLDKFTNNTSFSNDQTDTESVFAEKDFLYVLESKKVIIFNYGSFVKAAEQDGSVSGNNFMNDVQDIFVHKNAIYMADFGANKILVWQKFNFKAPLRSDTAYGIADSEESLIIGGDSGIIDPSPQPNIWVNPQTDDTSIGWEN